MVKSNSQQLHVNHQLLGSAIQGTPWDLGNDVLYELCKKYPKHDTDEKIIAKIWLIGRSYSAAIERRKNSDQAGEKFYVRTVAPIIRNSGIDMWMGELAGYQKSSSDNYAHIIAVHKMLTDLFVEISGMEKRSLASKYLHFHFPDLFYIYDSRAASSIAKVTGGIGRRLPALEMYDNTYARFFLRCMSFVEKISKAYQIELTPRRLDTYLLELV